ncbi:hypothetical protein MRB53_034497 [Persea americana]|uniref:Uncharacterized protein n=1 Tax=Persea americana TaxID=3435 RepID=A0ACC2K210_PERAE|nr:hypothetical protein MRB53_034497 [Persea americana]
MFTMRLHSSLCGVTMSFTQPDTSESLTASNDLTTGDDPPRAQARLSEGGRRGSQLAMARNERKGKEEGRLTLFT